MYSDWYLNASSDRSCAAAEYEFSIGSVTFWLRLLLRNVL